MLHRQLIAVGLADGAVLIRPAVPDVRVEVVHVVGLLLPYPEQFVDCRFEVGFAQGYNRKFLRKVIAVDYAEFLDRVRGRSVQPFGSDGQVGIPYAVVDYVAAGVDEYLVGYAHIVWFPLLYVP